MVGKSADDVTSGRGDDVTLPVFEYKRSQLVANDVMTLFQTQRAAHFGTLIVIRARKCNAAEPEKMFSVYFRWNKVSPLSSPEFSLCRGESRS